MSASGTKIVAASTKLPEDAPSASAIHEQVASLAYSLWLERGSPVGSPEIDWFQAEQFVAQESGPERS